MIKKCPACNSARLRGDDKGFRCLRCGYEWRRK
jgi:tRNA(Ile2) C34 agmatinyltransferase TiaS